MRKIIFFLSLLFSWMLVWNSSALAVETGEGQALFELHCAGCHEGGGNIVRRGKNLKLKTLQKNQFDTVESIAELVTSGRGNMSPYRDRITPEEIQSVSTYVLERAHQNWEKQS